MIKQLENNMKKLEVYKIYYHNDGKYVVMEWNGYATSQEFREGTEKMLQVLIENKADKVLGDIRDMVIIGQEDQKWLNDIFLPKAILSGFKAIALIQPIHYFNKVAVESVAFKVKKELLRINFFSEYKEAKAWLESLNLS